MTTKVQNLISKPYEAINLSNKISDIFIQDSFSKDEDRLWVPLSPGRWSRPLCYNI